jgi:hypothetical protein
MLAEIKEGFQSSDHNGWIKLDRRDVSINAHHLSSKANATTLDFGSAMPDVTDLFLRGTDGARAQVGPERVIVFCTTQFAGN